MANYKTFEEFHTANKNKTIQMYVETPVARSIIKNPPKAVAPEWTKGKDVEFFNGTYFRVVKVVEE
jgi:hypothetical protein